MAAGRMIELQVEEPRLDDHQSWLIEPSPDGQMYWRMVANIFTYTNGNDGAAASTSTHHDADISTAWRRLINDTSRVRGLRKGFALHTGEPPEQGMMEWNDANCDANVLLKIAAEYACNGQGVVLLNIRHSLLPPQKPRSSRKRCTDSFLSNPRPSREERQRNLERGTVVTYEPGNEESITSLIYLLHYHEVTTAGICYAGTDNTTGQHPALRELIYGFRTKRPMLTGLTSWLCTRPEIRRGAVDRMFADIAAVEISDCIPKKHTDAAVVGALLDLSSSEILKLEEVPDNSPGHTCCNRQKRAGIEVRVFNMDTGRMEMYSGGNYICLSYVWQQWDDDQLREQLLLCNSALPSRLIWCDRWSIVQSDEADVKFWVSRMDAIYEHAMQVVVLVGEHGGDCMSRPLPRTIHGWKEIESWAPAIAAWKSSQWHTRVWTMQEAMLAGDAQVFFRGEPKGWNILDLAWATSISASPDRTYVDKAYGVREVGKAYRARGIGEDAVKDSPLDEFGRIRERCVKCGLPAEAEVVKMPLAKLMGQALRRSCKFPGDRVNGVAALADIKVPMMPKDWALDKCVKALLEGGHIGAECMALGVGGKGPSWLPANTDVAENQHVPDMIPARLEGGLLSVRAKLAKHCLSAGHGWDSGYTVTFRCIACEKKLDVSVEGNWKGWEPGEKVGIH